MDIKKEKSAMEIFEGLARSGVDKKGVYPTPGVIIRKDGGVELYANALSPYEIILNARMMAANPDVIEQIVAIDTYCKEGQGTALDSCLIVFHCKASQQTRIGVLEYSWNGGSPITKSINWSNEFWIGKYRELADKFTVLMRR